jgi:AcrR family transcriptional regulator
LERVSTRERILRAASTLFASRGYTGTTTREIATLVQVRQPSLFHHFPSKAAIADALLDYSLERVTAPVIELASASGSAAERLYGYVHFDTGYLASSPYCLSGLYTDDLMLLPEFDGWRRRCDELNIAVTKIIDDGLREEEFVLMDAVFAQRAITALTHITMASYYGQSPAQAGQFADDVATYALRGLLSTPRRLPDVRRAGVEIARRLNDAVAA